jgi:protein-tyrosine sulfotransferase
MTQPAHDGVIVLGSPRSGTTLLRRILNAHPEIACPGETNVFSGCARFLESERVAEGVDIGVLSGLGFAGFDEQHVLNALREFAFGFHREYAKKQNKPRWASKTAFDLFYLDAIEKFCGNHAYFICLQRHGLDVACSLKELCDANGTYLRELHDYIKRYPRPLEAFCHVWVDLNQAMHAFIKRHPNNALFLKYEDLVADPESTTRKIAEFVKVDWSADWVGRAMQSSSSVGLGDWKTYTKDKIDSEGVGRWKKFSKHTISAMAKICNPTLVANGYSPVEIEDERSAEEARRRYELGLRIKSSLTGQEPKK